MNKSLFILTLQTTLALTGVWSSAITAQPSTQPEDHKDLAENIDRQTFGNSPLPLWSQLTDIETATLTGITNARRGDSNSLLAFYILASGDVRTRSDYQAIMQQVQTWLTNLPASIQDQRDTAKQAEALLHAMHAEFFLQDDGSGISGYSLDQTQITRIFATKHYNCISSALLYLVLAEHYGLNVDGVLMPSHAFVQLTLPSGKRVDIETTTPNGYDIKHDEEFYAGEADWFIERQLLPPSYDDYLSREIISPFQLGLEDMWSQHSDATRMGYIDRSRLAEIRGYLQTDNENAQINRLIFYNREFGLLEANKDFNNMARMFSRIESYLQEVSYQNFSSQAFWGIYNAVAIAQAFTYVQTDRADDGMRLAKSLQRNLDKSLPEYESLNNNLFVVLNDYAKLKQGNQQFDSARLAYTGLEYECVRNEMCASGLAGLYAQWGQYYWNKKDWINVIAVFQNYLAIDNEVTQKQSVTANLESAYLNWAGDELNQGEWEAANGIYSTCLAALEKATRCETQQQALQKKAKDYY